MIPLLLLLLAAPVDRHGDDIPAGAAVRMGTVRLRSANGFTAVTFTPDGKRLVSGDGDGLTVWDVVTGKRLERWTLGVAEIADIRYSADGKVLGVSTNQGLLLLDPKTGAERKRFLDPTGRSENAERFALSADGKYAVIGYNFGQGFRVVDTATGAILGRVEDLDGGRPLSASFTPDGLHFVTPGKEGHLTLFATKTARPVRDLEPDRKGRSPRRINTQGIGVVTADGKEVLCRTPGESGFVYRELATGKVLRRVPAPDEGRSYNEDSSLVVLPGGRFAASTESGSSVRIRALASGKLMREIALPDGSGAFAVSPDGTRLVLSAGTALEVWDLPANRRLHDDPTEQPAYIAWTRDGRRLASFAHSVWRVWDARTGLERSRVPAPSAFRFAPWRAGDESFHFLGADRSVYRWAAGERDVERLTTPNTSRPTGPGGTQAQSRDGRWTVARARRDVPLRLVDLLGDKGEREVTEARLSTTANASFSPDSRLMAAATGDREVLLVDPLSAKVLRRLPAPPYTLGWPHVPNRLTFSPDGRLFARLDVELTVVEVPTGDVRLTIPRERILATVPPTWSECGRMIALGLGNGEFAVYDAWTGAEVLRRQTDQGPVRALAFSPDGRRLATVGVDTTLLVWDVPSLPPLEKTVTRASWGDLASSHAGTGWRGMLALIAAGEDGVRTVVEKLKPVAPPDEALLAKLVGGLGDPAYRVREASRLGLEAIGEPARAALERAKRGDSLDARRTAELLLAALDGDGISPARLRRLRAVEVLERVGSRSAVAALRTLAGVPDADVAEAAKASLARVAEAARSVQ